MDFRKMVTITLYRRQQKRHWCIEQSFELCGRGRGWDDLGEWHWNMYNIIYETSRQSRFDARYWMLGAGALGRPRGMVWGGRREEGSGWGTHVCLWRIHFDIWQSQYNRGKKKKKVKEESEKVGLKVNIQKTKIMASGPSTSWQIDGETMETVTDFILLGSKITSGGDCNREIKRQLLLGRKAMTNLDSILKSRDITLLTKVHLVKAMVFQ